MKIPFLHPNPALLSSMIDELRALEASHKFTNFGAYEQDFCKRMKAHFGGVGGAVTVCNATLGLMIAIRHGLWRAPWTAAERQARRYVLVPSFSFAAIADAIVWNGLTPWFVDIDPDTWVPSPAIMGAILERHHHEIALMLPAATFGNGVDIQGYETLSKRFGIPVVIDAAASLGCLDHQGRPFGAGSPFPVVYSMHATKVFATAEAGLIYCADEQASDDMRHMSNFGFSQPRTAILPGLNAKLSEVGALLCLRKLEELETIAEKRKRFSAQYLELLPDWTHQKRTGTRLSYQFYPVLLPDAAVDRQQLLMCLKNDHGVEVQHYFSPHLIEQPFFAGISEPRPLGVTEDIARRVISLPMHDAFTDAHVPYVANALEEAYATVRGVRV